MNKTREIIGYFFNIIVSVKICPDLNLKTSVIQFYRQVHLFIRYYDHLRALTLLEKSDMCQQGCPAHQEVLNLLSGRLVTV